MNRVMEFRAPVHGGKYHLARPVSGTAICNGMVLLDVSPGAPRIIGASHPICCRRCAKIGV